MPAEALPLNDLPYNPADFGGVTIEVIDGKVMYLEFDAQATTYEVEVDTVEQDEFDYLKQLLRSGDYYGPDLQAIDNLIDSAFELNPDFDPERRDEEDAEHESYQSTLRSMMYTGRI